MAEQDLDRSEAATPFKLERARNRGAVAKSPDVNGFAILAVAMVACFAWLPSATHQLSNVARQLVGSVGADLGNWATTTGLLSSLLTATLHLLSPLLIAIMVVAILSNLAQSGGVLSAEPLTPDFTRLNPARGLRKLFALKIVYDAIKSVFKLLLLGAMFGLAVTALLPGLAGLADVDSHGFLFLLFAMSGGLLAKLLTVVLVLAAIDFVYVRREYAQRMRMSRREIKDEYKQREGDPRIRQRIRELRVQMLRRSQATRHLPQADVLVTNPTHVAVAISYEHGVSSAPKVIAKGAGSLALRMRDVAYRHRVPIVESGPLARALYREVDDGGYVPEQWYPQVAKILVWVLAARRARDGSAATRAAA